MLHVPRNMEKIEIGCTTKTQNFVISEHLSPWKLSQNVRLLVKVIVLDVSGTYIWHPYWLSAQSQTVGRLIQFLVSDSKRTKENDPKDWNFNKNSINFVI